MSFILKKFFKQMINILSGTDISKIPLTQLANPKSLCSIVAKFPRRLRDTGIYSGSSDRLTILPWYWPLLISTASNTKYR